jgi:hypothetical protein
LSRYATVDDLPPQMREQARRQITGRPPPPPITFAPSPGIKPGSVVEVSGVNPPHAAAPKPRKYRNNVVHFEGVRYDSQLELDMCISFHNRWKLGEIRWFIRQVPFVLEGGVVYRADALVVLDAAPFVEVWDAKGLMLQASKNKLKQFKARYGFEVKLWRRA